MDTRHVFFFFFYIAFDWMEEHWQDLGLSFIPKNCFVLNSHTAFTAVSLHFNALPLTCIITACCLVYVTLNAKVVTLNKIFCIQILKKAEFVRMACVIGSPSAPVDHRTGRAHVSRSSAAGQQTAQTRPAGEERRHGQHHPHHQLPQGQMAGQRLSEQL